MGVFKWGVMDSKKFNEILEKRIDKIKNVLSSKEKEYASGFDRLHNFKVAARIMNETPEKALFGMLLKHIVSVIDMVNDPKSISEYLINEKIGDVINYFILLESLMWERIEK